MAVEIVHRFDDLREDVARLVFRKPLMFALLDALEQVMRGTPRELGRSVLRELQQFLAETREAVCPSRLDKRKLTVA